MIIFDLDGTLANCDHRRYFVDPLENPTYEYVPKNNEVGWKEGYYCNMIGDPYFGEPWKPDWRAFHDACDKDKPIMPTRCLFDFIGMNGQYTKLKIWSGRCESVRENTENWLKNNSFAYAIHQFDIELKMRPIGDSTPDDQLKEKWLDEYIESMYPKLLPTTKENEEEVYRRKDPIHYVFESDPKSIKMWRRRGIFVFDVSQGKGYPA